MTDLLPYARPAAAGLLALEDELRTLLGPR